MSKATTKPSSFQPHYKSKKRIIIQKCNDQFMQSMVPNLSNDNMSKYVS